MPVVNETITDGEDPVVGATVTVRTYPGIAYNSNDNALIGVHTTTTDVLGAWTVTLPACSALTPSGTVYLVHVRAGSAQSLRYIDVPNTAGPFNVVDILTVMPEDVTSGMAATSVSITDDGAYFTGSTVEAALQELGAGGGGGGVTIEQVNDAIGSVVTAGTGITKTIDDPNNTVTIAVTAGTYDAAGSAAAAQAASEPAGTVATHSADTTNVHGITDTSALETTTGSQAKVDAHVNDTSAAHAASAISFTAGGTIAGTDVQTAVAEVATDAATALSNHEADTTSVHGIADTSALVTTSSAPELIRDTIGTALVAGTYIDVTVNDGFDTITIEADVAALSSQLLPLAANGANVTDLGSVEHNVTTVGTSGSTETLDTSASSVFDVTMDQGCTFTFSNPAPSGDLSSFVLILRGAFTPTFPASVDWGDASPPTYTTPSVYTFTTVDAGTTWLGVQAGKAFG